MPCRGMPRATFNNTQSTGDACSRALGRAMPLGRSGLGHAARSAGCTVRHCATAGWRWRGAVGAGHSAERCRRPARPAGRPILAEHSQVCSALPSACIALGSTLRPSLRCCTQRGVLLHALPLTQRSVFLRMKPAAALQSVPRVPYAVGARACVWRRLADTTAWRSMCLLLIGATAHRHGGLPSPSGYPDDPEHPQYPEHPA